MDGKAMCREFGQTLSEYVLILMGIVIVAVVVLSILGNQVATLFNSIVSAF